MPARKMIQVGKVESILKSIKAWSLLFCFFLPLKLFRVFTLYPKPLKQRQAADSSIKVATEQVCTCQDGHHSARHSPLWAAPRHPPADTQSGAGVCLLRQDAARSSSGSV